MNDIVHPTPDGARTRRRVLFVENGIGYGGAVICLRHLVRNLDRARFEPVVVTGRTGDAYREIASEAEWHYIPDRRVDVVALRQRLDRAAWVRRVPGLYWLARKVLARIDDVANFLPLVAGLVATMRRSRPALIHANNEPLCNRAALIAGKLLRVPVVCHVRGDQRGSWAMRWLYGLPDHFVPVSRWVSEGVGRMGVPPEKRTPIYDGIELDKLDLLADGSAFRREHGIPKDAFAVGLVGLLIPWKGQELFFHAGKRLLEAIPNVRLVLVGGTPEDCRPFEARLRAMAAAPPFAGRVVFTGHVGSMSAAYNALDVVVSASTSPEPLGTVVIESLALGRALVAPAHGGAVEMIEHGKTGLLFAPGSADALAEAILQLHGDPAMRERLGIAARKQALATFSVAEHARRVQEIYERVLDRGGGVRRSEVAAASTGASR
jgi:glycosyltransferase involved in cell wall biosynthesis